MLSPLVAVPALAGLALRFRARPPEALAAAREAVFAVLATMLFAAGFSLLKGAMPLVAPFFADPAFAALDRALHLGVDPWRLAHDAAGGLIDPRLAGIVYFDLWIVAAFGFPLFLAAADRDAGRRRRFILLYVFVWIGLGNVAALAGLSAGPVYYGRLTGAADFAGLEAALAQSGLAASHVGRLQEALWTAYAEDRQAFGSGISAFPSVHVAIAALIWAYLAERGRLAGLAGAAVTAAILFLSVYTGWHYAVDGYASIVAVWAAWAALRRRGVASAQAGRNELTFSLPVR